MLPLVSIVTICYNAKNDLEKLYCRFFLKLTQILNIL